MMMMVMMVLMAMFVPKSSLLFFSQGVSVKSTESGWSITRFKPTQSLVDYSISDDDEKEHVPALPQTTSVGYLPCVRVCVILPMVACVQVYCICVNYF